MYPDIIKIEENEFFYKKLIMLRKEKEVIARGNIEFMEVENAGVLAYTRSVSYTHLSMRERHLRGMLMPVTTAAILQHFQTTGYWKNTMQSILIRLLTWKHLSVAKQLSLIHI